MRFRGTREASKTRIPTAKAMSVAIGMPHPWAAGVAELKAT